ncbi:MAG: hypothetical protein ACXAEU_03930 [Candidatus Hodarchaeales archaeon]|jgi:hypothetical protein
MKAIENHDPLAEVKLENIVRDVFKIKEFKFNKGVKICGASGEDHLFDFFLFNDTNESPPPQKIGVMIFDYRKHLGTDSIIKAEKTVKDCAEIEKILVVSNGFSTSADSLAKRADIMTFNRGELVSVLNFHKSTTINVFDA